MAIKNLLIAYNGGEASDSALHLALQMADKYDAHLTGIVAHGASSVTRNIPSWLSNSMRDSITEITAQRTNELAEKFRSRCAGKIAADRLHWIDVKEDPDRAVSDYSRMYDITVIGQYENLIAADELVLHPDRIAYEAGRPILVAPKSFRNPNIIEKAVVAWDGRRTAARAFFDAMQVLETKDSVEIVTVGNQGDFAQPKSIDLATILERHGVTANHHFIPAKGSIAETILSFCNDVKAGMLVTGAYQHSKLSEDLFGGVTSSIMKDTKIPLFLSH
ncbi:universal stress protein [Epibacterium sp. SM1969]|uniref:Universal stress protein n=1 Tax=Tritonibacter aquimaris TaxID=2663379 RepID=A0A844AWQ0_9RHOB|nr:universal stress protein [Tritonibacter aquimaris]MQY43978.1 universal stress protein [Tritonibacter aquimaris]